MLYIMCMRAVQYNCMCTVPTSCQVDVSGMKVDLLLVISRGLSVVARHKDAESRSSVNLAHQLY